MIGNPFSSLIGRTVSHTPRMTSAIEKGTGLGVELDNDANACLLAETWFGRMDGVRNAVLVAISEGIGTGILANGHLVTGERGMAGEFGHICIDPEGPVCGCGARGCWEVFASTRAALRYYHELQPGSEIKTILELMSLSIDGDRLANKALEQQARAIGQGMHLLNAVLSPDMILIASDITVFSNTYFEVIERECRAGLMAGEGPQLVVIGDGEVTRLRGAAAVALQRHSGYYRANHTH